MEELKVNKENDVEIAINSPTIIKNEDHILSERNRYYSLPIKYWVPTLISFISATAILIWFVSSTISKIENDVQEVKTRGIVNTGNSPIVINTIFLEGVTVDNISENQSLSIKNVVFALKQRSDLVLVIGGYNNDNLETDQFQKATESKKNASRIKDIIVSQGVDPARVYFDGFGQNVPRGFPKSQPSNVALMVVDVFELMKKAISGEGGILKVI